jgi:ADP-heptose:LPS heptosyltransferase
VILEVPGTLLALLKDLDGVSQLLQKGGAPPAFDFHCPLPSLPLAFKTDLRTVPSCDAYLASDPAKVAQWTARLGAGARPRVGLVWSGSTLHKNDRNRSIALRELIEYLPPQYQYVSLQKETRQSDEEALRSRGDILRFDVQLDDFADTAALCQLMDVVISVDTSVAHLAGAMGKPVWVMLPFIPDWRWLLDREDSVWYPSARLFRQEKAGDWAGVLGRVRAALLRMGAKQ